MLGGEPGIQQELMRFQVETGTRVCTGLDDLGRELIRLRRLAAAAAAPSGLPPGGVRGRAVPHARVTDQPRYPPVTGVWRAGTVRWWPMELRLPRARRGPLPDLGVQVLARAAALACAAAPLHRQLPDRRAV